MVLFSGPTFQKKKSSRTVAPREIRNDAPSTQICSAAKTRTKHFLPPREVIDKGRAKKTDRHRGKEDRQTVQRQYGSNGLRIKRIMIPHICTFKTLSTSLSCAGPKISRGLGGVPKNNYFTGGGGPRI